MSVSIKNVVLILVSIFICLSGFTSNPQHHPTKHYIEEESEINAGGDTKESIKEFIQHHLKDSYSFNITHGVGFSLPVIIWDGELKVFMSNKIEHEHEYKGYTINHHGELVSTSDRKKASLLNLFSGDDKLFFDFSISKNVFVILMMSLFLIFIFGRMAKKYRSSQNPGGAVKFLEPLVIYVRDEIARPNIGEKHYKRYMSFLLTVFFFIWFLNLAGMTPLGIGVTNNIAVTFSLAIIVFLITSFTANKHYWGHIFWMPGVPKPMRIMLAPIEILGMFVKPFSLMIRLYANMTAGHIVVMSIIGLIFLFQNWFAAGAFSSLTLVLSLLELLVAALQAYIFTMLAALYFGAAVEEHH